MLVINENEMNSWVTVVRDRIAEALNGMNASARFNAGITYRIYRSFNARGKVTSLIQVARGTNTNLSYLMGLSDTRASFEEVSIDMYQYNIKSLVKQAGFKTLAEMTRATFETKGCDHLIKSSRPPMAFVVYKICKAINASAEDLFGAKEGVADISSSAIQAQIMQRISDLKEVHGGVGIMTISTTSTPSVPRLRTIAAVCKHWNLGVDYVLGYTDEETPYEPFLTNTEEVLARTENVRVLSPAPIRRMIYNTLKYHDKGEVRSVFIMRVCKALHISPMQLLSVTPSAEYLELLKRAEVINGNKEV